MLINFSMTGLVVVAKILLLIQRIEIFLRLTEEEVPPPSGFLNEEVSKEMMTLKWLEHSSIMKTPSHYYYCTYSSLKPFIQGKLKA